MVRIREGEVSRLLPSESLPLPKPMLVVAPLALAVDGIDSFNLPLISPARSQVSERSGFYAFPFFLG